MTRHRTPSRPLRIVSAVVSLTGVVLLALAAPAMADTTTTSAPPTTVAPLTTIPSSTASSGGPTASQMLTGGAGTTGNSGAVIAHDSGATAHANVGLIGDGSSFAGPEVLAWATDVAKSPYNLTINFTPDSSGQGRFDFGSGTVDFAVSDIPYQGVAFDTAQPKFPFIYVPVTAGGLAFMYHLDGMPSGTTLKLSSYSACAIFSGGVTSWNSPIIQADNPGVNLPDTPIHPVIRTDLAGTNFVFQEWCIHEQPKLWAAFVDSTTTEQYPGQVGDLSATAPRSDWPLFAGAIEQSGSANAADTVANPKDDGYITAVETAYAIQRDTPVASVKNASGYYTQPSAVGVASALAYATQNANGTHNLDFDGAGQYVYNPSTYSYLLTPTTGWSAAKGDTMSQLVNYALTLGQKQAPSIGYASLGLSLERYGVNSVDAAVPGAVKPTAAEAAAYNCGDLTPAEVVAGQQTPTCGVTNSNNSSTPGQSASGGGSSTTIGGTTGTTKGATAHTAGAGSNGTGSAGSSTAGSGTGSGSPSATGADAAVSLGGSSSALATTGGSPLPIAVPGFVLLVVGLVLRRRLAARLR